MATPEARATKTAAERKAIFNNNQSDTDYYFSKGGLDNARQRLIDAGYPASMVNAADNSKIFGLLETIGSNTYERSQRALDRQDSMNDFRAQLADLTASKQRQAEQAGRIAQNNTRSQGLAQMMSNF
jgi:hypothetical protein